MNAPIYVTEYAHSPMPRRIRLGCWRWEIRDAATGPLVAEGTALTRRGAMWSRGRARNRCKRKPVIKHRMAPARELTDADRQAGLALINACMESFAAGMRKADDRELLHEAERLEALPKSPVVRSMRAIVDGERAARARAVVRA